MDLKKVRKLLEFPALCLCPRCQQLWFVKRGCWVAGVDGGGFLLQQRRERARRMILRGLQHPLPAIVCATSMHSVWCPTAPLLFVASWQHCWLGQREKIFGLVLFAPSNLRRRAVGTFRPVVRRPCTELPSWRRKKKRLQQQQEDLSKLKMSRRTLFQHVRAVGVDSMVRDRLVFKRRSFENIHFLLPVTSPTGL